LQQLFHALAADYTPVALAIRSCFVGTEERRAARTKKAAEANLGGFPGV
jgi:hypothetical protein